MFPCLEFHDGFDDACLGLGVRFENFDHVIERSAVCDPWSRIDLAIFDQLNDPLEVFGQGISGHQQRDFFCMQVRMSEGNLLIDDADVDDLASVVDVVEYILH